MRHSSSEAGRAARAIIALLYLTHTTQAAAALSRASREAALCQQATSTSTSESRNPMYVQARKPQWLLYGEVLYRCARKSRKCRLHKHTFGRRKQSLHIYFTTTGLLQPWVCFVVQVVLCLLLSGDRVWYIFQVNLSHPCVCIP